LLNSWLSWFPIEPIYWSATSCCYNMGSASSHCVWRYEARTYKVPFLPKEKIVDGYGAGDGFIAVICPCCLRTVHRRCVLVVRCTQRSRFCRRLVHLFQEQLRIAVYRRRTLGGRLILILKSNIIYFVISLSRATSRFNTGILKWIILWLYLYLIQFTIVLLIFIFLINQLLICIEILNQWWLLFSPHFWQFHVFLRSTSINYISKYSEEPLESTNNKFYLYVSFFCALTTDV